MKKYLNEIIKILFILCILIVAIGILDMFSNNSLAAENDDEQFIYLSNIPYDSSLSKTAWGSITMDKTTPEDGSNTLALKLEGNTVVFKKVFLHMLPQQLFMI